MKYITFARDMNWTGYLRLLVVCGISICCWCGMDAQVIREEPAISELVDRYVAYNLEHTEIRGWRIQILSTTERRIMESTESKFKLTFPEYRVLFEHQDPYYHLKTGAFLTQQDARSMLRKIQESFPGAFLVTDKFEVAEVLDYQE